jgi:hypothetical protein
MLNAALAWCVWASPASSGTAVGPSFWPPLGLQHNVPHSAVVRILAPDATGWSQGSGSLIAVWDEYGLVITNWHVVRDAAGAISVGFPDGFRSAARVVRTDADWDLAALLIWRPGASPLPISSVAPRPGDVLTIAGHGSGQYRVATGRCTQYVAPASNLPYEMVEVSAAARQGDSGGPILNAQGELVGVLFGSGGGTTAGSYCGRVRHFLVSVEAELRREADAKSRPSASPAEPDPTVLADLQPSTEPPFREETDVAVHDRPGLENSYVDALPRHVDLSPPADSFDWQLWVGTTPLEQAKSLLAAIGILATVVHLARWSLRQETSDKAE